MVVVLLNGGEFGSLACTRAALQAAVTVPLRLLIPPLTLGLSNRGRYHTKYPLTPHVGATGSGSGHWQGSARRGTASAQGRCPSPAARALAAAQFPSTPARMPGAGSLRAYGLEIRPGIAGHWQPSGWGPGRPGPGPGRRQPARLSEGPASALSHSRQLSPSPGHGRPAGASEAAARAGVHTGTVAECCPPARAPAEHGPTGKLTCH